ncbi:PF07598 family protein [Leptospira interrogans serovar Pyrogenes str. 200701872]|uniref:PF07598 family protein n=1 Tax=Leptospira interrogans serovar Pyrogenes str. 200701872 TaxID=1193029 RepID=M6ZMD2_LEPIR|nr:PF07598 family protein [Leptospira interrogans serovar Pyrogenes str. 200701872]
MIVLLVLIGFGLEYGINPTPVDASSKIEYSVIQKPTDPPKDKPIKVIVSGEGKFCYGPDFSGGESYIIIEQCWQMHVMNARYDVFQRISYNINNTWLCITAPEKVIKAEKNWDYVHLRPCTINDPLQRWIIKNNSFWTADGFYRLKNYNWYGYISRNSGDRYNHTLDPSMNDWVNTVATPGNISIQTSIAWNLQTTEGQERYFIRWGGSDKNTTPLYYNPESGHIAQYDPISGSLYCMYSQVGGNQWNWVTWALCSDAAISKDNPAFWNVFFKTEEGGIITDYKGNLLRVTRYGSNWGVAYAAKPDFVKTDTKNSPTSLFVLDKSLLDWTRYTYSNLGKTDQYCPAGKHGSIIHRRVKRTLPPDFQLTEEWIQRLYAIARSTTRQTQHSGICGVCLLQTFQMLAELQEYHSQGPLSAGGYFFDTAPNADPFISFRQRYPLLDNTLSDAINIFGPSYNTTWLLTLAYAITMLPQYEWTLSNTFNTRPEILSYISSLINSPPGSIWLAILRWRRPDGTFIGHSVPILRTSQGLVVIPTNVSSSRTLENFRQSLIPSTDPNHIITNLERPNVTLTRFTTIELGGLYQNTFDFLISNNNCTGEGEDRRGTGNYPSSTSVNQCSGDGRCALPF